MEELRERHAGPSWKDSSSPDLSAEALLGASLLTPAPQAHLGGHDDQVVDRCL